MIGGRREGAGRQGEAGRTRGNEQITETPPTAAETGDGFAMEAVMLVSRLTRGTSDPDLVPLKTSTRLLCSR